MTHSKLSLTEIINKRKSVKEFDSNFKIPREEMKEMIALATKAPSSINLQPWRFVIIDSEETKIRPSCTVQPKTITFIKCDYSCTCRFKTR